MADGDRGRWVGEALDGLRVGDELGGLPAGAQLVPDVRLDEVRADQARTVGLVECDLLVATAGRQPSYSLLNLSYCFSNSPPSMFTSARRFAMFPDAASKSKTSIRRVPVST